MSTEKKLPSYVMVDNFRLPGAFYPQAFRDVVQYKPREDDIFLVTYPKCGTNWMSFVIYLIYNKGETPKSGKEFFKCCPFPDGFGIESITEMTRPGVIRTHLPFHLHPYLPKAKYIFVARNPKDCCISFYHHTEDNSAIYNFSGGDFNDYFELFMKGEVDYGDYFDHVMSWYEHRHDPNVLWLTYEEMKADVKQVILKVGHFLGEEYGRSLESDADLLQKIADNSSVKNMKVVSNEFFSTGTFNQSDPSAVTATMQHSLMKMKEFDAKPMSFRMVRKGIVGDWRNAMTPEQVERIDKKTEEKMGGTKLLKYWKEIGAV